MKTTSFFVPLFAAAYVSAHGFLNQISINGKVFTGNVPSGKTNPSVIRQITTQDPIKGATNPAVTCGTGSTPGSLIADANPGDTVSFDWRTASLGKWPHNTGPMLTYMANCGQTTCDKFDISQAKWFKIDQVGRKPGSSDWAQVDLFNGQTVSVNLPKTLAPGNYILRHEIIALHLATSKGGAEFYEGCSQLRVGGSQTGAPAAGDLVSLPGAYSDSDPGIFDPSVFDPSAKYIFPGPPVASFVSGTATTGSGSGSGSGSGTPTTNSPPKASSTKASSCKIKKRPAASPAAEIVRPRHISRVMRRLAFDNSMH
ncbi:Cellulose-growth-specific protein [Psilocybe cubensis]|uniref:Cellulose-growth-specific protein n=2 Tax=Psilocybe cubensis TaxID=181762 RepID=A0ACB8GJX0_PSICU|nr:Cellulose-growth-specific protein [Psilocybe cubensis]KAH9475799.1 Cellulose-growth-specific protein [Psilocybe cubensis]